MHCRPTRPAIGGAVQPLACTRQQQQRVALVHPEAMHRRGQGCQERRLGCEVVLGLADFAIGKPRQQWPLVVNRRHRRAIRRANPAAPACVPGKHPPAHHPRRHRDRAREHRRGRGGHDALHAGIAFAAGTLHHQGHGCAVEGRKDKHRVRHRVLCVGFQFVVRPRHGLWLGLGRPATRGFPVAVGDTKATRVGDGIHTLHQGMGCHHPCQLDRLYLKARGERRTGRREEGDGAGRRRTAHADLHGHLITIGADADNQRRARGWDA